MCTTCGCSKGAGTVITDPETGERIETPAEGEGARAERGARVKFGVEWKETS